MQEIKDSEILFIVNPNSGKKDVSNILEAILENKRDLSVVISENKDGFKELIESYLTDYKVFVAVGGDGTVNTVANHLTWKKDKILAVFPAGSGNGFAREMGFDKRLDELLKDINIGLLSEIDVLEINKRKFVNVAGIGFDAAVAHHFHKGEKRGFLNYALNSVKTWFSYKPVSVNFKNREVEVSGNYFIVTFANTRQFGNNAIISPNSDASDGIYEIILVKPFPFLLLPYFVFHMFRGTIKESKYVQIIKTSESVQIESNSNYFHFDGEPEEFNGIFSVVIHKKSLSIINRKQKNKN